MRNKKFISLVCAISMVASAFTSLVTVSAADDTTVLWSDSFDGYENVVEYYHADTLDYDNMVLVDGTVTAASEYAGIEGITLYTTDRADDSSYWQITEDEGVGGALTTNVSRFSNADRGAKIVFKESYAPDSSTDLVLAFKVYVTNDAETTFDPAIVINGDDVCEIDFVDDLGIELGTWADVKIVITPSGSSVYVNDSTEAALKLAGVISLSSINLNGLVDGYNDSSSNGAQKAASNPFGYPQISFDNMVIYTTAAGDGATAETPTAETKGTAEITYQVVPVGEISSTIEKMDVNVVASEDFNDESAGTRYIFVGDGTGEYDFDTVKLLIDGTNSDTRSETNWRAVGNTKTDPTLGTDVYLQATNSTASTSNRGPKMQFRYNENEDGTAGELEEREGVSIVFSARLNEGSNGPAELIFSGDLVAGSDKGNLASPLAMITTDASAASAVYAVDKPLTQGGENVLEVASGEWVVVKIDAYRAEGKTATATITVTTDYGTEDAVETTIFDGGITNYSGNGVNNLPYVSFRSGNDDDYGISGSTNDIDNIIIGATTAEAIESEEPSEEPTEVATEEPTETPTEEPTETPTPEPTATPAPDPDEIPTYDVVEGYPTIYTEAVVNNDARTATLTFKYKDAPEGYGIGSATVGFIYDTSVYTVTTSTEGTQHISYYDDGTAEFIFADAKSQGSYYPEVEGTLFTIEVAVIDDLDYTQNYWFVPTTDTMIGAFNNTNAYDFTEYFVGDATYPLNVEAFAFTLEVSTATPEPTATPAVVRPTPVATATPEATATPAPEADTVPTYDVVEGYPTIYTEAVVNNDARTATLTFKYKGAPEGYGIGSATVGFIYDTSVYTVSTSTEGTQHISYYDDGTAEFIFADAKSQGSYYPEVEGTLFTIEVAVIDELDYTQNYWFEPTTDTMIGAFNNTNAYDFTEYFVGDATYPLNVEAFAFTLTVEDKAEETSTPEPTAAPTATTGYVSSSIGIADGVDADEVAYIVIVGYDADNNEVELVYGEDYVVKDADGNTLTYAEFINLTAGYEGNIVETLNSITYVPLSTTASTVVVEYANEAGDSLGTLTITLAVDDMVADDLTKTSLADLALDSTVDTDDLTSFEIVGYDASGAEVELVYGTDYYVTDADGNVLTADEYAALSDLTGDELLAAVKALTYVPLTDTAATITVEFSDGSAVYATAGYFNLSSGKFVAVSSSTTSPTSSPTASPTTSSGGSGSGSTSSGTTPTTTSSSNDSVSTSTLAAILASMGSTATSSGFSISLSAAELAKLSNASIVYTGTTVSTNVFNVGVSVNGTTRTSYTGFDPVMAKIPYTISGAPNTYNVVAVNQSTGAIETRSYYTGSTMYLAVTDLASNYSIVEQPLATYSDVTQDWALEAISAMSVRNVIAGVGDDLFDPEANVTRAQFTKMLVAAMDVLDTTNTSSFTDVATTDWYYPYIATAENLGIVTGVGYDQFDPNASITREDMATMLFRAADVLSVPLASVATKITYSDEADMSDYATTPIYRMQQASIMQGVGDGAFEPKSNTTRAQAAVAIYNIFKVSMTSSSWTF